MGLRLGVEGYKRMSARGRMDKVLLESLSSEPLTWEFVGKGMVVFGMQRQWQSAEVALNFPVLVLEELIERGFFKKLRDREVEGLVPADAGAMADQKPPVSLGQPERAGYKYADLKCASLDTLVDQEIDVTSCYETCRENNS
ncbi:MAG: hypothetical protein N2Z23_05320 [Pyrinomonadaceae bacterium]|nr:hypothetical protein [Pyrinomonadaceae bacterium]